MTKQTMRDAAKANKVNNDNGKKNAKKKAPKRQSGKTAKKVFDLPDGLRVLYEVQKEDGKWAGTEDRIVSSEAVAKAAAGYDDTKVRMVFKVIKSGKIERDATPEEILNNF